MPTDSAHLADIVEISVWRCLLSQELLVRIQHDMQIELLLQQHEPMVAEALDGAHSSDLAHPAHVIIQIRPLSNRKK